MPYSDSELQQLYGDLSHSNYDMPAPAPPTKEEEEVDEIKYKRLKQAVNIVPKAVGSIASGLVGINEMLFPENDYSKDIAAAKGIAPSFSVGKNEGILDVALNEIAPEIGAFIVPYTGALKVAKAAKAARTGTIAAEGIGQGIGGFLQKSDELAGGLETGALGGVSGVLQTALPRLGWAGRLAPLAGVSTAYGAATGNWGEAGINLAANMLPGMLKGVTKPVLASSKFADIADDLFTAPPATNESFDAFSQVPGRYGYDDSFKFMEGVEPQPGLGNRGLLDPGNAIQEQGIAGRMNAVDPNVQGQFVPQFQQGSLDELLGPSLNRSPQQLDLGLQSTHSPSGVLAQLPGEAAENAVKHLNNDALLRLEGQNLITQELDPLLSLQSAGSIKPGGVNFSMVASPTTKSIDPTGELSHWRNAAVNRPTDTLLLESPKTVIHPPKKVEVPLAELPLPSVGGPVKKAFVLSGQSKSGKDVLAEVPISKVEKAWSKDSNYIGPKDAGLTGRREKFKEFLKGGKPIEAPEIQISNTGAVSFGNGRHRFSVLRDQGDETVGVAIGKESIKNAEKFGFIPKVLTSKDKARNLKMKAAHEKGQPFMERDPEGDFIHDGTYLVTLPNGVKKKIFRDSDTKMWYETASDKYDNILVSTGTKEEGFKRLMEKYGSTPRPLSKEIQDEIAFYKGGEKAQQEALEYFAKRYGAKKAAPLGAAAKVSLMENSLGEAIGITPKMEGPHIVSTVLHDVEGGRYLVGNKWNAPHQKGTDNIYMEHGASPAGDVKSAFAVVDFDGNARVIVRGLNKEDDELLGRIARAGGQVPEGHTGSIQSEDLIDSVVKTKPKNVEQHIAAEVVTDKKVLESTKQVNGKLVAARQELHDAEWALKEAKTDGDFAGIQVEKAAVAIAERRIASLLKSEAGMTINPAMAVMVAAGAGGLVTYQQTKGDMGATIAAAIIIAGLGFGGAAAFRNLSKIKGPKPLATTIKIPQETIKEKIVQFAKETTVTPAGLAVGGRGGIHAGAVLAAESFTGMNRIAAFKDFKIKGDGFISLALDDLVAALRKASVHIPTPAFAQAAGKFLRGQLSDPVEVQNLLNSGGIISGEGGAWSKLSFASRKNYPERWLQLDDANNTNLKGDGVTIWHVTNSVKQQLLKNETDALLRQALTPDDKAFSEYAIHARKTIDILQAPIFAAAGPKEGARIIGTMGQYTTRSHALITDPKFYPAEPEIAGAMAKLAVAKVGNFLSSVEGPGLGAVKRSWGGVDHFMSPAQADNFDNLYTPESLRAVVTQRIKEIKQLGAQQKAGLFSHDEAQFAGRLFTGRKELDDVTQALLGTHNAPHEIIRDTINKLIPAARSAHVMLDLTSAMEKSGLPGRFASEIDYSKALNSLKRQLTLAADPRKQQVIQNQLDELTAYMPIGESNPSMGLFQGSFVSRHVHSQLDEMMNPLGLFEDVIGTGLRTFNNYFKETHLVMNPVTQARNFMQIPAMLVIGRAAHDVQALKTAFNIIYKGDRTSAISRWAVENGVTAGNAVHGELNFGMKQLMSGEADTFIGRMFSKHTTEATATAAFKKGHLRAAAHLAYAKPDDFVRTATFIAAARRSAKKLGIPEDQMHLSKQVTDEAREFMARRSMDYANVPQWVKVGRQIPLVTPFLTYSHEIVRITGNMAIDSAKGDLVSGAGLAALATLPFLAQGMAEDALSPEDKKAWLKGQAAAQDYSRPRFKLPGSRNSDGTFNYHDITPLMPFGDYLMMGRAMKEGDLGSIMAVNPLIGYQKAPLTNLIAEQAMGKDIHTQREFRTSWDRAKNILQEITPPWMPGIGTDAEKDWPEWMGGRVGQTNMKTGRTYTIKGALMRNIFGVDESQVNPDIAVANMIKGAQRDIANERAYLRDAMMSKGLSTEGKQRAAARYAEAVRHITDQIAERVKG